MSISPMSTGTRFVWFPTIFAIPNTVPIHSRGPTNSHVINECTKFLERKSH